MIITSEQGLRTFSINNMTGLRDSHVRVLASMKVVALTGISFREHAFLYEMSGTPSKMFF